MIPPEGLDNGTAEEVNLRWVIASGLLGALLIGIAFAMEDVHKWQGVSTETMVSLGSAFLLAAVLFFLQRRFVTQVSVAASRAATTAVDTRIYERDREVEARLDQLDQRMADVLAERSRRQDAAVRALDIPTYETVADALAEANRLGALANGRVMVQASTALDELGLQFSWGQDAGDGRFGSPGGPVLTVHGEVYADEQSVGGRPVIETPWQPGEPAHTVGLRIRAQLETSGRWHGEGTLDWPMALRNLQRSLDIAIRSRRRDDSEGLLQGALFELVGEDWAITEAGLECPRHKYLRPETSFPERPGRGRRAGNKEDDYESWMPEQPAWTESELWELLIRRAKPRFPIRRGPMSAAPRWSPLLQGPRVLGLIPDQATTTETR